MKYFYQDKLKHISVCNELVNNYEKIKKEILDFISIPNVLVDYPNYKVSNDKWIYENYWKAAPVSKFRNEHTELTGTPELNKYLNSLIAKTREHCPTTVSIIGELEEQEHLSNSFISRLMPGTIINPHTGWSNKFLRIHLGIVTDPNCKMFIEDESMAWEDGKLLAFVDGHQYPHSVKHEGYKERIVLSIDLTLDYLKSQKVI